MQVQLLVDAEVGVDAELAAAPGLVIAAAHEVRIGNQPLDRRQAFQEREHRLRIEEVEQRARLRRRIRPGGSAACAGPHSRCRTRDRTSGSRAGNDRAPAAPLRQAENCRERCAGTARQNSSRPRARSDRTRASAWSSASPACRSIGSTGPRLAGTLALGRCTRAGMHERRPSGSGALDIRRPGSMHLRRS